jgi:hypothetical protein
MAKTCGCPSYRKTGSPLPEKVLKQSHCTQGMNFAIQDRCDVYCSICVCFKVYGEKKVGEEMRKNADNY